MAIFPTDKVNKSEEASRVLNHIHLIERDAKAAKSLDNRDVLRLYRTLYEASNVFNELAAAGYTADVLGPVIGEMLEIDWSTLETMFLDLKNTHAAAYVNYVLANQQEICQQEIQGNNTTAYVPISTATKDELLVLINNITVLFPE